MFNFIKDVVCYALLVVYVILAGGSAMVGGLAIVGSMFFEVAASQLTLTIIGTHIGVFLLGVLLVAIALKMLVWLFS